VGDLVRSLPVLVFLVALALLLAMAAVPTFVALRTRTRVRLLAATPTSPVATAREGRRAFEGRAEALGGATLAAPLTGAPCCWYSARLEKFVSGSGSNESGGWRVEREATSGEPFLLRDATGVCAVLPDRADVTWTDQSVWQGSSPVPSERSPKRFRPGEPAQGKLEVGYTGQYRYTEARIYPGDPLLILGDFTAAPWETGDEPVDDVPEATLAGGQAAAGADWFDPVRLDAFYRRAERTTSRRVAALSDAPYLISTTLRAELTAVQERAWKGALGVAMVPFAVAVLLVWIRLA
jgi:hypothetical protein